MSSLNWIKNLYQFDKPGTPSLLVRRFGSLVAIALASILFFRTGSPIPLIVTALFIAVTLLPKTANPFFLMLSTVIFILIQTVTLLALAVIFAIILIPMSLLSRLFGKREEFFKNKSKETIEKSEPIDVTFERLF